MGLISCHDWGMGGEDAFFNGFLPSLVKAHLPLFHLLSN